MKKKINILIAVSLIAIVALSAIQYYLISNTFQLKKDAFIKEVKAELKFVEVNERIETWDESYNEIITNSIKEYKSGLLSKEKLLNEVSIFNDSLNAHFNSFFKKSLLEKGLGYDIKYQEEITSAVLINETGNDTILSSKENSLLLFGTPLDPKTRIDFNSNKWSSNSFSVENPTEIQNNSSLHFEIRTESYMDIPEWRSVVLKQMMGLLSLSILSILTVIVLFIYALRSFIKQKKIADIKTDFINNITHELNTPLATLSIATKTIQQEAVQNNKELLNSTVNTIDRQRNRLQKLIDQVLINSLGSQEIQLHYEVVSSKKLLKNIISDYQLTKDAVDIKNNISKIDCELRIDKFHFTTAVLNVLENAVKYGGSIVEVSSKTKGNMYQISIKDNGIGMAKEEHQKVLEKFYRIENKDIHNVKGLGLGLYYVHQIIKAHKGSFQIESTPQKGTIIIFNIPIKKHETDFISRR